MTTVKIEVEFKAKCPRVALACVTAEVSTGATPEGLDQELARLRREHFEIGGAEGGAGVGGDFGDAGGVQGVGERSGEVSRIGGGALAAGDRREGIAAH